MAVGEDLVLLTIPMDAYLCLPGAGPLLQTLPDGRLAVRGRLEALRDGGLVGPGAVRPRAAPARPTHTIIHQPHRQPLRLADLAAAIGVWRDLRTAQAQPGLQPLLDLAKGEGLERETATVVAGAKRFWRLMPWLPIEGECLVRSAMLIAFLRRLGLGADWVFGVRLWPFCAHCWVQIDDVCLNDDVERLAAYQPIFVA